MKKIPLIHSLFLAFYPVLFLYAKNIRETPFQNIMIPLGTVLVLTSLFFLFIWLALKDIYKTAIIVSLSVLLVFTYGHVYDGIKNVLPSQWFLLVIWALIFLSGLFFIISSKKSLINLSKILSITSLFLVILPLSNIVSYHVKNRDVLSGEKSRGNLSAENVNIQTEENLPDIYFLIFDRYADQTTQKKYYQYNNQPFLDQLKAKGFYVAESSRSNYLVTALSLSATFEMKYLDYLADQLGQNYDSWLPLYNIMQSDYSVWQFLRSRGYAYIHAGSWWPPTNKNKTADININLYTASDFSLLLFSKTVFYPLTAKLGLNLEVFRALSKNHYAYDTTIYQLESLKKITELEKPTFTFAHFLIPHDPYVFDEKGNFVSEEKSEKRSHYQNYREQLIYTNKIIDDLTDYLITKSKIPPIIILQSDEGPYPERWIGDQGQYLSWDNETDEGFKMKTGILNAFYLSGGDTAGLYPSITPVNTFRYIFSRYFGADLPLLPDQIYAHDDVRHPYHYFEITDRVNKDD